MKVLSLVLLFGVVLAGCTKPSTSPLCQGEEWVSTQLFFGLSRPDGGEVSEAAWQDFVEEVVVPRFPEGFTVLAGQGYYRAEGSEITISEPSRVILRVHLGAEDDFQAIEEIAARYRKDFAQVSVLQNHGTACVDY